jgi:hypothetical protein
MNDVYTSSIYDDDVHIFYIHILYIIILEYISPIRKTNIIETYYNIIYILGG